MKCYVSSPQWKEIHAARIQKMQTGSRIECIVCGASAKVIKGHKNQRFCSRPCFRSYMAARFDRAVADPPQVNIIVQCFDEFLDQDELPCLIRGCGWRGRTLSYHMNASHGIGAAEFKQQAGFNLSTGVVGASTSRKMGSRRTVGVVAKTERNRLAMSFPAESHKAPRPYQSREGKEHRAKARAEAKFAELVQAEVAKRRP